MPAFLAPILKCPYVVNIYSNIISHPLLYRYCIVLLCVLYITILFILLTTEQITLYIPIALIPITPHKILTYFFVFKANYMILMNCFLLSSSLRCELSFFLFECAHFYAFPPSGEAYCDRLLTHNFFIRLIFYV